jgi:tripartite-type tricarboxylate transporter receptor subunit TctC
MALRITRRGFIGTGAATIALPLADSTLAQAWPSKPIKIVCAYPAGGLADLFARAYGDYISQKVGQPVVVENKPGAGGTLAAQAVKAAPADGYTLLFAISATILQNRVLYKNLPYDTDKDFVLVACMPAGNLPFVAQKSTGATNFKEFVEYARKNKVSIGTFGPGTSPHVVTAELNKLFGLEMEAIHYRGEAPMWQDLTAGVIQAGMGSFAGASNVLQSGAGRVIAVTRTKRMKKLPDVATFLEQGLTSKVFQLTGYICAVGPTGMPQEIVDRLSGLIVEGARTERIQKLLDTFGIDELPLPHEEFKKLYAEEGPIWISAVQSLGLTPE